VDAYAPEVRSRVMAAVRSKGNRSTEWALRAGLVRGAVKGWQLHPALPGTPDFAFLKEKLAVFVDGCFWHGCSRCYVAPKARKAYWVQKIHRNMSRDRRVSSQLRKSGWRVMRIWEHDLDKGSSKVVKRILASLGPRRSSKTSIRS
jgi:DNA mismatch endonuclease, patch repair protein